MKTFQLRWERYNFFCVQGTNLPTRFSRVRQSVDLFIGYAI